MSNRHLPAGQNMQGGLAGMNGINDMNNNGGGMGGRPRRGRPQHGGQYHHHHHHQNQSHQSHHHQQHGQQHHLQHQQHQQHQQHHQHQHQQHQQHQQFNPIYSNYAPYSSQPYYAMPAQYQNATMPSPGYMPYQNYSRSPQTMHQYAPMGGLNIPPVYYPPVAPQSPSLQAPYQPPPPEAPPMPPQTPSSTQSSQVPPPPTPPTPQPAEEFIALPPKEPALPEGQEAEAAAPPAAPRVPFRLVLPWYSRPDLDFPVRSSRLRRRRRPLTDDENGQAVSLPVEQHGFVAEQKKHDPPAAAAAAAETAPSSDKPTQGASSSERSIPERTPSSPAASQPSSVTTDVTPAGSVTGAALGALPVRPAPPAVPALPRHAPEPSPADKSQQGPPQPERRGDAVSEPAQPAPTGAEAAAETVAAASSVGEAATNSNAMTAVPAAPPVRVPPTSWANLFAKPALKAAAAPSGPNGSAAGDSAADGAASFGPVGAVNGSGSFAKANANGLGEAIRLYQVDNDGPISFLEPRGLINTGNMCYMNSVLQVLIFCTPFYDFLDQVSRKFAHSFKSETPLIDSMIMFMREYKVLKSASSGQQLERSLKSEELERYGEPFTPEFVYEAIRQLPRFANMRRGHQQDAEEFLGFLLQSLDDECTSVINSVSSISSNRPESPAASVSVTSTDDWLEVGRKQRSAVTRSSGHGMSTPITKVFGGLLRSEFRVPGLKDSITTERYQPLQLDIGSPDVNNVIDALRGLTRPERLQGDFNSPRGKDVMATKQVLIDSLPPVLILHLKRFQFDAEGRGTVKIWKKIGYPLNLEIPREVLSRQTRQAIGEGSLPRYKLISVVYHHGKNASGGHYTVDVRRQDGREWIRLDDTVIRRVRSEDIAEVGAEADGREATSAAGNRMSALHDEDAGDEDGWKRVAPAGGKKQWSSVVVNGGAANGAAAKEKHVKDNAKDNKVAYLLFYQRV